MTHARAEANASVRDLSGSTTHICTQDSHSPLAQSIALARVSSRVRALILLGWHTVEARAILWAKLYWYAHASIPPIPLISI